MGIRDASKSLSHTLILNHVNHKTAKLKLMFDVRMNLIPYFCMHFSGRKLLSYSVKIEEFFYFLSENLKNS